MANKGYKEKEFISKCENLSHDGKGCIKYNGHVGFFSNVLPGEEGKFVMTYYNSNQFYGHVKELTKISPDRVKPICPNYEKCGGCALQHMSYEAQLKFKQNRVEECLKRIGGFKDIKVNDTVGMEEPYFYRNKIQMPIRLSKKGKIISGFYQEKTHDIAPIDKCYIENNDADRILSSIKEVMKKVKVLPYDEDKRTGVIRHVLIRTSYHFDEIMVVLVCNTDTFPGQKNFVKELIKVEPKITTIVQNINTRATNVILGDKERVLYGKGFIKDTLCGVTFKISAKSFYQVNPLQTERLYSHAISLANLSGKERVLDAYCGIGTIGLIASKKAKEVVGVEIVKEAVFDAKNNAKNNNITNANFYEGDAGQFIVKQKEQGISYDVVIMDPPRKGSDEAFLSTLIKTRPERVVYVSCDPSTLARDLKYLASTYSIESVTPFDMFPQTYHVECITLLQLKEPKNDKM